MIVNLPLMEDEAIHLHHHLLSHRYGLVKALFQETDMPLDEFEALVVDKEITSAILDRLDGLLSA